jgi:phage replication O-like protein O
MGNPQCEDGYTKIANELLEAMSKIRIPGEACQLLLFILRKTYGFNKKHDGIATSQIMEGTNLGRRAVERARSILRRMNMISTVKNVGTNYLTYCINKFYKTWISTPKKDGTVKNRYKVPSKTGTKYPPKGGIQKKKENIQKKDVSDEYWLTSLKANPLYSHVSFESEFKLMDDWFLRHPDRVRSRGFILNWIKKVEKPISTPKKLTVWETAEKL